MKAEVWTIRQTFTCPRADPTFLSSWLDGHSKAAAALGKPLVLEEFGKVATQDAHNISATRDPIFKCAICKCKSSKWLILSCMLTNFAHPYSGLCKISGDL